MMARAEFFAYPPYGAVPISSTDLMHKRPTRISGIREMEDGEYELCLFGSDIGGSYFGYITWSQLLRKPLPAGWLQGFDFMRAANCIRRRQSLRNLFGGQTDDEN